MTDWNLSVDLTIFQENLTIRSTSQNPRRFQLQEPFPIAKVNVVTGLASANIQVPQKVQDLIPQSTHIDRLVIDGKTNEFEVAIRIEFGEDYIVNTYPDLVSLDRASFSVVKGGTAEVTPEPTEEDLNTPDL